MDRLVNAGSWQLVVELTHAIPDLQVFETHPGGGQYDCLTVVGAGVRLDINRAGSIHAHESPWGQHIPLIPGPEWQDLLSRAGGPREVASRVAALCGLPWTERRPPTTPRNLTYRVLARLLLSRLFSGAEWDTRSWFLDTSGPEGCAVLGPPGYPEIAELPPDQVWRVLRDGLVIAWAWQGWGWTPLGERIDLMAAYRRGTSIDTLATTLSTQPRTARADSLPALSSRPEDPTIGDAQ